MPRFANAPCSWGVLEFEEHKGAQIGWRQMLDELKATGYTGTELGDLGFLPTDKTELVKEVRSVRGLDMLGAFVSYPLWGEGEESRGHDTRPGGALPAGAKSVAQLHADGRAYLAQVCDLLAAFVGKQAERPYIVLSDAVIDPVRIANAGKARLRKGACRRTEPWECANDELEPALWAKLVREVQFVKDFVEARGLRVVFHFHGGSHVETYAEIVRFLHDTNVDLVFDTGHFLLGCRAEIEAALVSLRDRRRKAAPAEPAASSTALAEPQFVSGPAADVATLERRAVSSALLSSFIAGFGNRIATWHFKDFRPAAQEEAPTYFDKVKAGVFCELGDGDVDFGVVRASMEASHYKGWIVVEQDVLPNMGAPKKSAQRNREFLAQLFGPQASRL